MKQIKNKEYDLIKIIECQKKSELIGAIDILAEKYFIVDMKFSASTNETEGSMFFYYSILLFLQYRNPDVEIVVAPKKEELDSQSKDDNNVKEEDLNA